MRDPQDDADRFEAAARRAAPWSSDPLDDIDWTTDEDGTVHLYPSRGDD